MRSRRRYSIYLFCLALPLWYAYRLSTTWRSNSFDGGTTGAALAVGLRSREDARAGDGSLGDGEDLRGFPSVVEIESEEGGAAPPPFPAEFHFVSRSPELSEYLTGPEMMQLIKVSSSTEREADSHGNRNSSNISISSSNNNNNNNNNNNSGTGDVSSSSSSSSKAKGNSKTNANINAADGEPLSAIIARIGGGGGGGGSNSGASRCAGIDMSVLDDSLMACGAPLSSPCFDRDRCKPRGQGGPGPSMYVYDATCSLANSSALPPSGESLMLSHAWREAAREAGVLSETYRDACIFVHVNKLVDRPPCASASPLWNGGANHVMVDLTDRTRDAKHSVAASVAMDASSNMRSCYYRSGFDFSVPLRHKLSFANLTNVAPWERKYFLTVKGNLYLSGNGHDERLGLVPLHNEAEGIVVALNCFEMHGEHLLPENADFCNALNVTSSRHDYGDLMNATFGLVPAGRSPATYRLAEVMSAGSIPVFVAIDYVRPFPERVDWPSFSLMFPPEALGASLLETLRAFSPEELWMMQQKSLAAFLDIFGEEPGYSKIARVVIDELVKRVGYH